MNLKDIVSAFGVAGFEDEIREIVKNEMEKYGDEVEVDKLGNVVSVIKGGKRKVMLVAHMDQIGFMVRSITDEGYLVISPIGGVNPVTLRSHAVRIKTDKGFIYGVIGENPPHLGKKKEKKEMKDLRVDIGVDSKEDAMKIVKIGDVGSFIPNYYELNGKIVANSLDDRIGIYTLLQVMKNVKSDSTLYFVASVQEEIGLRGARVSSFALYPDIGIAVDVTHATMPDVSKEEIPIEIGKGPTIGIGATSNPKIFRHFVNIAEKNKIPYQIEANSSYSGTDADIVQMARDGVATTVISIPERYMHSSVEMLSKKDVDNTIKLLRIGLKNIGKVELKL